MAEHHRLLIRPLAIFLLALVSQFAVADDIDTALSKGEPNFIFENGGFFEIGLNAFTGQKAFLHDRPDPETSAVSGLGIEINGSYQYKRFFIEATRAAPDGLNMGFALWRAENWSVDFLAANINGNVTVESDEDPPPTTEEEKNDAILVRDTLFIAAGMRVTRYFGNHRIAQFRLVSDYFNNNGLLASARFGQQWQFGNWSWTGYLGTSYTSSKANNYLVGVSADEATTRFPEYSTKEALTFESEISVSYPLTRKLVFASRIRYRAFPKAVTDSPLVDEDSNVSFRTGIIYVF